MGDHDRPIDDHHRLVELVTGYQPAAVITAAVHLGLFDALDADRARPVAEVAGEVGADAHQLGKLLAALEWLGLAVEEDGAYRASPFAAAELRTGADWWKVVHKESLFARVWNDLAVTVRSGRPLLAPFRERLLTDPRQTRMFLEALDALARHSGPPLAELGLFAPGEAVVDVGGGLGTYSRMLAAAGVRMTLVELPQVAEWAEETIGEDVEVVAVDVFTHPSAGVPPASMDGALVSHLLHDLAPGAAQDLLGRVVRAVRPGGRVVVNDFAGDGGPGAFGPLFDLMMSVETGGNAYSLVDLMEMMASVGIEEVERVHPNDPVVVLTGVVP